MVPYRSLSLFRRNIECVSVCNVSEPLGRSSCLDLGNGGGGQKLHLGMPGGGVSAQTIPKTRRQEMVKVLLYNGLSFMSPNIAIANR